MNKHLLLSLLFCFSGFITTAQTQLWFNTAVKAHPADFTYPSSVNNEDFDNLPIFNLTIGADTKLGRNSWHLNYALSYNYVESRMNINPSGIAPGQGFIKTNQPMYFVESINLVGIKIGVAPLLKIKEKNGLVSLPFGAQGYLPIFSKGFTQIGDSRLGMHTIYNGDNIKYAVFYGLYFRPTYRFKLTQNRWSPWSFGVYAEGDLLILNESESNPKWTAGGGLELRYSFGKRSELPSGNLKF